MGPMPIVERATVDTFDALTEGAKGAVLVKFEIANCQWCEVMEAAVELYADKNPEIKCVVYRGRNDGQDPIFKKFGLKSFPAFVGFVDGKPVQELGVKALFGAMPMSKLGDVFKTDAPIVEATEDDVVSVRELTDTQLNFLKRDIEAVLCERQSGADCGKLWCNHIKVAKSCYIGREIEEAAKGEANEN